MRIIPKKTKVALELFKGVGLIDIIIGLFGASILILLLSSNIPFKTTAAMAVLMIFVALLIPFENDKVYMMLFHAFKYIAAQKKYVRRTDEEKRQLQAQAEQQGIKGKVAASEADVADVTPFVGIDGNFIDYGKYYGVVVEVPSIEFRFMTAYRQNYIIDKVLGSVLRTVGQDQSAAIVKIDRPVIYDDFIKTEYAKIDAIKEAYVNGLIDDQEIISRVAIVYDRIDFIKKCNYREKVYKPFHYLVFFDTDKNSLQNKAENAVQALGGIGMDCSILNQRELAIFLKYNYSSRFDEREIDNLTPDQYMNWILPKTIEINTRTVKYDDIITHNLRIVDYPRVVGNAWGYQLFNMMRTRVVMKMRPVDTAKAIRQIDRALDELRVQLDDTGKSSKIIDLGTHINTLSELLVLLKNDNETLFDVNTYVTIYDYDLSEYMKLSSERKSSAAYISLKKDIKRQLSEAGFKTNDMFAQQVEAYASSQVSARDGFAAHSTGIHSSSIAAAFPFVFQTLSDKGGVNIGVNGVIPIFINFFKRDRERVNSNMVIIGKSGSGKSYATKTILANLAAENSKIFILDPENEYGVLAKNLNGKIIDVGSATQGRMNPFHVITTASEDEGDDDEQAIKTSFNTHLQFLEEFFRQILQGIENDALEFLNNIIVELYKEKGIDSNTDLSKLTPEDFPIFDDLFKKITRDYEKADNEYNRNNLRILMNYISKFAAGGRNAPLWNGPASISTNENFIVFNFQSLLANKNNLIANAQMLLVLKWLDNEIIKNRDYNIKFNADRKIIVVIDEAHVFIDTKFPIALDFMYQLAKRIRKYNGMQIIITQNVRDFAGTEEVARKSTAIISASQYSFIFPLAPNDMNDLCKLYEKAGAINESEQEEIVNNGRGRAFLITSASNRTSIDIVASDKVKSLFSE